MGLVNALLWAALWVGCCLAEEEQWTRVSSEVIDSSEYGQHAGVKGTNCSCGWTNKGRIVGGRDAEVNEYPYMAALVMVYANTKPSVFCGCTIVTQYHAVTAAHCTDQTHNLAIVVGEHDLSEDKESRYTQMYLVDDVIPHEMYDSEVSTHDIALLVTSRRMVFNTAVGPACMPTHRIDLTHKYVKVTGWGALEFEGSSPEKLQKVSLRVVPLEECAKKYPEVIDTSRPTHICTLTPKKDACQGDSGGPVVWLDPDTNRYTLVGVVSFGMECATDYPGVSTDVGSHSDWLQYHIHSKQKTPNLKPSSAVLSSSCRHCDNEPKPVRTDEL
ncbi:hypothetical protein AAG570_001391 [Ranatra chinensis]|uniref:Peptidase S1 domain-containing protein n=1 Tax=Ranatra chinensis TaxID=642074 RepID=A0ABD0YBQ7_9HEMI